MMFDKIRDGARTRREEKEREHEAVARRRRAADLGAREPATAPGSLESNSKVAKMMLMMGYKKGMGSWWCRRALPW
jgi:tuftelin-interacting protein 11